MPLNKEEIAEARKQLLEQVKSLPEGQRAEGEKQVSEMSDEAISGMVEQQRSGGGGGGQQVFRMMVSGQIDTVKVGESNEAIAVLEINPISRGHMFIIPKTQVTKREDLPESVVSYAGELAEKVRVNLGAEKVKVSIEEKFGEMVVEVIPDYGSGISEEGRKKIEKGELEKVKKEINTEVVKIGKKVEVVKKKAKKKKVEVLKLRRRIP
jgi:diadenosine tetraphosphate (Ap4A) HIT family hydrolase